MSQNHDNFKLSDSQNIGDTFDASDVHLTNARLEISNSLNTDPVDSMRPDTSKDFLPSANFTANSDSIVFGPSNPGTSSDGHSHNNGPDLEAGNQNAVGDQNHESGERSIHMADNSGRLLHQSEMSQQAARLGLGARDIAFIQQLESSVPHTSSRELAERLKAARNRGGILDLSRTATDNA
ncbi:MAG: hypothetical protein K2X29_02085 [Candidatus Obscuribacterales bacterium]|jgi:hypothetical protein|nr:hypothetical protein [Candidatus Obscuribacterales bacterium]